MEAADQGGRCYFARLRKHKGITVKLILPWITCRFGWAAAGRLLILPGSERRGLRTVHGQAVNLLSTRKSAPYYQMYIFGAEK